MKYRNAEVDVWRVILSLMILCLHSHGLNPPNKESYPFVGAAVLVENFFILSGYFSLCSVKKATCNPPKKSGLFSKFSRIFAYVIPAVIVHYAVYAVISGLDRMMFIKTMLLSIIYALLLMSGVSFLNKLNVADRIRRILVD